MRPLLIGIIYLELLHAFAVVNPAGVLVVGSANVDLVAYAPRMPAAGETISGLSFEKLPGGKGANQAVAAAKLGSPTRFITKLGTDAFGEESLENYQSIGINTEYISRTSEASTGVALITVDASSGQNCIVVVPGAGGLLCEADLSAASSAFEENRVLLTQLEVPIKTTIEALRRGRAAGMLTVCNTAPAPAGGLPDELLTLTDVLCPNESEAALLTGLPTETDEECQEAAKYLLNKGVGAVVMTLGERGCMLVTPDTVERFKVPASFDDAAVVDTIGAGDCFLGALAHRLSSGSLLAEAIPTAIYAASLSVQRKGAQASYPASSGLPAELI